MKTSSFSLPVFCLNVNRCCSRSQQTEAWKGRKGASLGSTFSYWMKVKLHFAIDIAKPIRTIASRKPLLTKLRGM